jgi:hypothetical protein
VQDFASSTGRAWPRARPLDPTKGEEILLRRLRRRRAQRDKTIHIRGILRAMRQRLDMAHHQGRAIEKEEGPAALSVIAPHFGGAVLPDKSRLAECRLQAGSRHVEILARLAARRSRWNGGGRRDRRWRRRHLGGAARGQQSKQQTGRAAHHDSLLHQQNPSDKGNACVATPAAYKRNS